MEIWNEQKDRVKQGNNIALSVKLGVDTSKGTTNDTTMTVGEL